MEIEAAVVVRVDALGAIAEIERHHDRVLHRGERRREPLLLEEGRRHARDTVVGEVAAELPREDALRVLPTREVDDAILARGVHEIVGGDPDLRRELLRFDLAVEVRQTRERRDRRGLEGALLRRWGLVLAAAQREKREEKTGKRESAKGRGHDQNR